MTENSLEKACTKCKIVKPLTGFNKKKSAKSGHRSQCRGCQNVQSLEYTRTTFLWQKYGMTPEDYEILRDKQKGVCAICKLLPGNKRLHVDHCHETGRVRGLLCSGCNTGLGSLGDSADNLLSAIAYLAAVEGEPRPMRWNGTSIIPPHDRHRRGDDHHFRNGKQLIGEKHGMALFTADQVREFRRRYDAGEATSVGMAREEGVSKPAMQAITSRQNWKHIE